MLQSKFGATLQHMVQNKPDSRPQILLLGPVRIVGASRDITPSPNKALHLLSLLAAFPNQPIAMDRCIIELWGEAAPSSPFSTVQTYIFNLRELIKDLDGACQLESRNNSYMLRVLNPPELIDASTFLEIATKRNWTETSALDVLGLWRGIAFADIRVRDILIPYVRQLDEHRRITLSRAYTDTISAGRPLSTTAIKTLYRAGSTYRTDERFLAGFAICLSLTPAALSLWRPRLETWIDYTEGELEANLGVGMGSITLEIFGYIESGQLDNACSTWATHYGSADRT